MYSFIVVCANVCVGVRRVIVFVHVIKKNTGLHVVVLLLKEGSCITYNVTLCIMYKCRYTAK